MRQWQSISLNDVDSEAKGVIDSEKTFWNRWSQRSGQS